MHTLVFLATPEEFSNGQLVKANDAVVKPTAWALYETGCVVPKADNTKISNTKDLSIPATEMGYKLYFLIRHQRI